MRLHMRMVEAMQTRLTLPLHEGFARGGAVKTATELHVNKALGALGARKLAVDPTTKTMYKTSYE